MKKLLAATLLFATATVGLSMFAAPANALDIRDHRICQPLDPHCHDHRGPVVVVPPPPPPVLPPPVVIVDPLPLPHPPHEQPHRPQRPHWPQFDDNWDQSYDVSCREARNIVRHSGFHRVQAVNCSGRFYRFNALSRRNSPVTVLVNHMGDIVRVNYWTALR